MSISSYFIQLVYLVGGIGLLFSAFQGIKTGRSSVFVSPGFKRTDDPFIYWASIITLTAAGLAGLFLFISDI
jgi:hypothetical protein